MKLSDYVIRYLEKLNIGHMFMLPGGGAMHLNDSLGKSEKIQYVVCLHEQACAIAAEAYARVAGTPGLLMVTTGPGGTNAITGVAAAYVESTPMIVISGQVKMADQIGNQGIRQQGMQELDIISIVKPITKYAAMVTKPDQIKYHLDRAVYEAVSGRKGPVWLDIPLDIQAMEIEEDVLAGWIPEAAADAGGEGNKVRMEHQVLEVIERLNHSKRPVLLAGNGIRLSGGQEVFERFVEELGIPVLTTWNGIDLIEETHPLFFGRPGGMGQRYANFIQQNSDFFLSVGARMNLLQTGYNFDGFAREAVKVMVDIDENELHKTNVRPQIPICADAKEFMELMLKHKDKIKNKDYSEWINYAERMKQKYPVVLKEYWEQEELVNTYALLDTVTEQMTPEDIYVSGSSGTCIDVSMQTFRVKKGQRVFSTKGLASMGFGVPATIGACLAGGGRRTVCVCGDGGFQMNIQELETIRRLGLPIKIFVLNNQGYAQIHATQKNIFQGHYVACDENSNLTLSPISDVARAYRLKAVRIDSNQELQDKVREVLEYDGPVICEVMVPIGLSAFPKQVSYKRSDGQMESLPLEYMNPMLPEEELRENMLLGYMKDNEEELNQYPVPHCPWESNREVEKMDYQVKKVMMTGGSGPVGLALIQKLLKENVEILLLQREFSDRRIYLPKDKKLHVEFCSLDEINSYIPKETDYDIFFHLGWANVGPATRNDLEKQNINVKYSMDAVELAKRANCHTFIGVGSQAEYGKHNEALKEDTLCMPETAYGIMKLCACHSTGLLCRKYGIRYVWPRVLSGYGYYDNTSSVLVSAILSSLDGKKMAFSKGEQIWDFVFMEDIADALYLIAKRGRDGAIYPIGSGKSRPLKEYIRILYEKLGKLEDMELGKAPYSDSQIMHLEADISGLQADTGWKPKVEFEDGIERVIEFYKDWKLRWEKRYAEWSRNRQEMEKQRERELARDRELENGNRQEMERRREREQA